MRKSIWIYSWNFKWIERHFAGEKTLKNFRWRENAFQMCFKSRVFRDWWWWLSLNFNIETRLSASYHHFLINECSQRIFACKLGCLNAAIKVFLMFFFSSFLSLLHNRCAQKGERKRDCKVSKTKRRMRDFSKLWKLKF